MTQQSLEAALTNLTSFPPPFPLPVPLSRPTLTVIPDLPDISEGNHLFLICGANGTPPVTFKWYREGSKQPLHTITSATNNTNYEIPLVSREHSGRYHCEADNHANIVVRSEMVEIQGETDGCSVGSFSRPPFL